MYIFETNVQRMNETHFITLFASTAENIRCGYVRFELQLFLIYCERVDFQYLIHRACKMFERRNEIPGFDKILFALAYFNKLREDKNTLINAALIADMQDVLHNEGLCSCHK